MSIVKDSSYWAPQGTNAQLAPDAVVRYGFVRDIVVDPTSNEIIYLVEIKQTPITTILVNCIKLERFGGAHNYEETTLQPYSYDGANTLYVDPTTKAGDKVVVAYLNGSSRTGVILGSVRHQARNIPISDTEQAPNYESVFNGVHHHVNKDGEYRVTFKGRALNKDKLNQAPAGTPIPAAEYDDQVGSSYFVFDKTGSYSVSDNAKTNKQTIKIDKPGGKISLDAGKISFVMSKADESVTLQSKKLTVNSTEQVNYSTKSYSISASETTKIRSPKVAIGSNGTELLDQITKLVDAVGKLTAISPVGPCAPMTAAPQWAEVQSIKAKIDGIKGSL